MRKTNSEYRADARQALQGKWGINVLLLIATGLLTGLISGLILGMLNVDDESFRSLFFTQGLNILILFAFSYSIYYVSLEVIRGKRPDFSMIFVIFQKVYYLPMLLLNLGQQIVTFLVNLVAALPLMISVGGTAYWAIVINSDPKSIMPKLFTGFYGFGTILSLLIMLAFLFIVGNIVSGIFRMAAWAKFDHNELSVTEAISYGWYLIKDRWGQFILLQLSFIGWFLLGLLAFGVGMLFAAVYFNTAMAAFYVGAVEERGLPSDM